MKKIFVSFPILAICFSFTLQGQTYQDKTIYTPNGTAITAFELVSGDYSSSDKEYLKNYWLNYYSNRIIFISEATRSYNCHAYAWHVSEGGIKVWINTPDDDKYWDDGSYISASSSDGTKVSFSSDDHSAITTSQSGYFQSKWGPSPLFKHAINDCPYNSSTLNYYKKACLTKTIQNVNYTTNQTVTGCNINLQNVTISNNSNLVFDVEQTINITGTFNAQLGTTLEIR